MSPVRQNVRYLWHGKKNLVFFFFFFARLLCPGEKFADSVRIYIAAPLIFGYVLYIYNSTPRVFIVIKYVLPWIPASSKYNITDVFSDIQKKKKRLHSFFFRSIIIIIFFFLNNTE